VIDPGREVGPYLSDEIESGFGLHVVAVGDAIIIGSAVRLDFLESTAGTPGTVEIHAQQIFNTLQRFKSLPDYMHISPAHGTQTYCDKALGGIPTTTVVMKSNING
jgi:hydroxyacylglutathione hydrolase